MSFATAAYFARRTPTCLALHSVPTTEVRVAVKAKTKFFGEALLATLKHLVVRRSLFAAMIAEPEDNIELLVICAGATFAEATHVKFPLQATCLAFFETLLLLVLVPLRKLCFEAFFAIAVVT